MNKKLLILIFIGFNLFISCKNTSDHSVSKSENFPSELAFDYQSKKNLVSDSAAVVTAHPLASEVGKYILKQGGNAIDASIAIQYALAVVYPGAGNIGGGGFMLIHTSDGKNNSIDFRETAAGKADENMYLDENGEVIPRRSLEGHLAAGIPGTVAGTFLAHRKYGKISMEELIKPAIELAEKGFVLTEAEAKTLNKSAALFKKVNTHSTAFVRDKEWKKGDTLIQKDLAETLKRISKNGEKEFYEGKTAELIVQEMQRGQGMISLEDLQNYKPKERATRSFSYKGFQIHTMDLPSSGGLMLEMMLKMLEPFDLKDMGFQNPETIHHIVEVERRAYADRTTYMGDPDFVDVPVDMLLDEAYLNEKMKDFIPGKAGKSEEVLPVLQESEQTTHLSVLDQFGNAVSVTTTLNTHYGSGVVVGGAGFLLNNEMDDFSIKVGVPNEYGLLGTEANKIEAGKRPVSSMMPTIVLKENKPFMVVGTPGGSTIITSVLQSILNVMEFDLSAEEAVNKPKFHHQWQPDVIYVEQDFDQEVVRELTDMGYELKERAPIGRTEMILVKDGKIHSAADKRGDDSAAGF